MSTLPPTCALGLAPATLSAWRDAMLDPAESARVESHLAGCAACQVRLAEYETIAGALRAERVPAPDARLWRDLRARVLVTPRHRPRALPGGWLGTVAAAVAVLVLVAGFARLFGMGAGQRTPPFAWRSVSLPARVGFYYKHGLGLSAADGNTAYACTAAFGPDGQYASPGDVATRIYVTHDRGQSWLRVADLPFTIKAHGCYVVADATDPLTAIATASEAISASDLGTAPAASFLTQDGGMTWQPLADPQQQAYALRELATTNIRAFAVRGVDLTSDQLVASVDGMQSWSPIDQAITSAGESVVNYWVVPGNGVSLLAEAEPTTTGSARLDLWLTENGGKIWTRVTPAQLPASATALYAVRSPAPGATWQACAVIYGVGTGTAPAITGVLCTTDGGHTWTARPSSPLPGNGANTILALGDDGALLGMVTSTQTTTLYRLPAGASQGQSLGATPGRQSLPAYVPAPDDGVLWLLPHVYNANGALDPHGAVYTAAYGNTPAVAPKWTPAPTPTPAPRRRQRARPNACMDAGDEPAGGGGGTVAPGDGSTAYSCAVGDGSQSTVPLLIWRTRDTGASWQRVADVPSRAQANACQMLVDPSDALHVVAVLWYLPNGAGGGPDISTYQTFVSTDGGASWTAVSTPPQISQITQIASYQGTTYALRSVLGAHGVDTELDASADGMQSWHSLTSTLTEGGVQFVNGFWLNRATGTLLAQTGYQDVSQTLWRSDDGGQHWTRLTGAPSASNATFLAQAGGSGSAWRVCGIWSDPNQARGSSTFACSDDGGLHWADQPTLAADDQGTPITGTQPLAVADDGALLVLGFTGQNRAARLYLLPPGATQWQECGQSSSATSVGLSPVAYASSPSAGVLWGAANGGQPYVARYP